ncbi:MAG: glycosyltransferase [bacterium]
MDFFIIANAWSAGKDNPTSKHRIALELVKQGHRVLWIEGAGMRTPSVGSSSDRLRMVRKVAASLRGVRREKQLLSCQVDKLSSECPFDHSSTTQQLNNLATDLWVLSPLFIPLPRYEVIRRLNGLICRMNMRFWGWRLGFQSPVLINYVPVLAEAMRGRHTARTVYHCVDRWDAFAMYDSAMMGEMDRRCCRYADLVIASAGELYDRCKTINSNTVLIPHGVDWEHFRHAVAEMQTAGVPASAGLPGPRPPEGGTPTVARPKQSLSKLHSPPTIGFFGLLSEWVDQDLLLRLAKEFPQATLILIGKADVDVSRLKGIQNIQLIGPKPFSDLPNAIAGFTVGIIPFVVNDLTRAVNPIKLREMLSAGCPVVSTALPEVALYATSKASFPVSVQIAVTHDDFVAMVRRVIEHPLSPEERLALSDSMAGETWTAKVNEILKLL